MERAKAAGYAYICVTYSPIRQWRERMMKTGSRFATRPRPRTPALASRIPQRRWNCCSANFGQCSVISRVRRSTNFRPLYLQSSRTIGCSEPPISCCIALKGSEPVCRACPNKPLYPNAIKALRFKLRLRRKTGTHPSVSAPE
ncbi:hypothetical protein [Rhizobium sp. CFBP 13726]|uniref:hypothetical protein n=1 Tax=Rhizobium sp. CFBP 13726 TaxID=2775296 RepID=UPI00406CEFA0